MYMWPNQDNSLFYIIHILSIYDQYILPNILYAPYFWWWSSSHNNTLCPISLVHYYIVGWNWKMDKTSWTPSEHLRLHFSRMKHHFLNISLPYVNVFKSFFERKVIIDTYWLYFFENIDFRSGLMIINSPYIYTYVQCTWMGLYYWRTNNQDNIFVGPLHVLNFLFIIQTPGRIYYKEGRWSCRVGLARPWCNGTICWQDTER